MSDRSVLSPEAPVPGSMPPTGKSRQSLRLRITFVSLLIALAPLTVIGALVWSELDAQQQSDEEQILTELRPVFARQALQTVGRTPTTVPPDASQSAKAQGALSLILDAGQQPVGMPATTPAVILRPGRIAESIVFTWHQNRWIGWAQALPGQAGTLVVARQAPLTLRHWADQLPFLAEVCGLLLLLVVAIGLSLGEAYARPLDLLTRKLRALARGDFAPMVPPHTGIHEFHLMATTLGEMAGHLQHKFAEIGQRNETLRIRFDEVQRHVDLLKSLGEVNQSLIAPTNLAMLLDAAFPKILEVCHLEVGCLFIRQGSGEGLHLQIAQGFGPGAIEALQTQPMDEQLPGVAARYRQVLVTENLPSDDRSSVGLYREDGVEAIIHIPLLANGAMIGVLAMGSRSPGHFTAHEVTTLITVANQLAIAIQNVQLYQQTARTKSQLEAILNALSDGLIVVDTEDRIILANRWAEGLLGCDAALQGSSLEALITRVSQTLEEPERFRLFGEQMQAQPDRAHRAELVMAAPVRRFVHLKGTPVTDADEAIVGWVILLQDTTQDREAQLALENARGRLEAIFHSLPHPVFVIDDQERIVAANPAFTQLYGLQPPLRLAHFLAATARLHRNSAEIDLSMRQTLRRPASQPLELEMIEAEHRIYQVVTQPLTGAGGTYAGALAVYQDITAERETARWQAEFIGRLEALVADRTRTLKEKDRRLSNLYTVQDVFRTAHSRIDLLSLIPRELCRTLEYDRTALYLLQDGQLRCAAAWSSSSTVTEV
ncbi:MAG: PAS domain-containing protein, partial [Candidatus Sericytochromatia bacterium]|nr:PAS domain-containing protein [Candidatus Sericytochromatia bacterium]